MNKGRFLATVLAVVTACTSLDTVAFAIEGSDGVVAPKGYEGSGIYDTPYAPHTHTDLKTFTDGYGRRFYDRLDFLNVDTALLLEYDSLNRSDADREFNGNTEDFPFAVYDSFVGSNGELWVNFLDKLNVPNRTPDSYLVYVNVDAPTLGTVDYHRQVDTKYTNGEAFIVKDAGVPSVVLKDYTGKDGSLIESKRVIFEDVQPQIIDSRTMLPIRAIAEELGFEASWDEETQSVSLMGTFSTVNGNKPYASNLQFKRTVDLFNSFPDNTFKEKHKAVKAIAVPFTAEDEDLLRLQNADRTILLERFDIGSSDAIVRVAKYGDSTDFEGTYALDVPAMIVDGRTLIPLRAVGEMLGLDVSWDDLSKTVTLSAKSDTVKIHIN